MVEFGKQLVEGRRDEWKDNYINYNRLKYVLKQTAPSKKKKKKKDNKEKKENDSIDGNNLNDSSSAIGSPKLKRVASELLLLGKDEEMKELYPLPPSSLELGLMKEQKPDFRQNLDYEIEKAVLFLLKLQGDLADALSTLCDEKRMIRDRVRNSIIVTTPSTINSPTSPLPTPAAIIDDNDNDTDIEEHELIEDLQNQWQDLSIQLEDDINTLRCKYQLIGEQVLQFIQFVELNVTCVRKILKKHDKVMPRNNHLSQQYLSTYKPNNDGNDAKHDSHLRQLYNYGGLSALVETLQQSFTELRLLQLSMNDHKALLFFFYNNNNNEPQPEKQYDNNDYQQKQKQSHRRVHSVPADMAFNIDDYNDDLQLEQTESGKLSYSVHRRSDTDLQILQDQLLPSSNTKFIREPVLEKIYAARTRLKQSTKYVEVIAAQALMMFDEEEEKTEEDIVLKRRQRGEDDEMTASQRISSFLNLASTFLYMTNYYIVAPTSGQYADRLGSSEALAGIIIGMTPNAALIATVLYGWWSNYSYKPALIFAATSSLLGNIFYATALKYNSLTMVMIGRFLNGFGSARSINRRFIADTFSREERTAASADFVTAGALGMAAGPAIAAMLGRYLPNTHSSSSTTIIDETIDPDVDDDDVNLLFTVETSPGWVMCGMWSIFLIAAILKFEEPDRSHLFQTKPEEKEEKELTMSNTNHKGENGETKPLLSSSSDNENSSIVVYSNGEVEFDSSKSLQLKSKNEPIPLYKNVPVMMTLWIYFILKLVLETLLSSSATLTGYYFHWDSQRSGTFLAFLGLLMFPANMVIARLSHRYEDRELIYVTLVGMFFSTIGFIHYKLPSLTSSESKVSYPMIQYIFFGICVFLTTNCLEGPNMSLLSKTIPKEWAKGTFNSGFLATEAGTLARSVGDVMISAAAGFLGIPNLLDATFVPLAILVLLTTILTRRYYRKLTDDDDDDDDDENSRRSNQSSTNST